MKLTKLQRYTAYIILLSEFDDYISKRPDSGFCKLIEILFDIDTMDYDKIGLPTLKYLFPELYNRRSIKQPDAYLFNNDKERKSALLKVIKETSPDKGQ